ncbi:MULTISPECIES: LacI family DNA-binding transcriptional regulator [unclassified Oceanispirochaeta]|uniref:LacI family DNA-binding transcriptional regulator n=1 Tax=unclassified Oceanispirochaeta TaxID=2635722 RepID=UPI000E098A76|nr:MULTISPECIES: LacI family DNA-binding transcriptional regulator [unclassified Oceanispirochaeta]MBF9018000.1 LacI family DNA-binding transcriptional regulator [Oceanispirochaeta sp. M2]NPD74512.1 LacI family transcriptional regulator [Oceanispirochaeta sp. M1]RDG29625.1 LacI family transcriptional regulator [Oceanispirochaeta sp. M1]
MTVKISDVAKKAGVSTATVSRIINNLSGFSDATKIKVQKAIDELGYKPNAVARGLASSKTATIGVLLPILSSRYSSQLIHGIETEAHKKGYSVIICNTDRNGERTLEYLRILSEKRVEGIIFASEWITEEYGRYMKDLTIPVVLVSTFSQSFNFPFVRVDDKQASYSATKYLLDKGHRNIGFISGTPDDRIAGIPRIEGYKEALADFGIDFREEYISYGDFHFKSGIAGMSELWNRKLDMTAVFASSDEMALGALTFLHEKGVNIPGEISVMGYDDTLDAVMAVPALSTLHQPVEEMGSKAVNVLLSKNHSDSIIMRHSITERKSVREL